MITQNGSPSLEPAHVLPGRIRLRWLGSGAAPDALLARLASAPDVRRVDYHPSSRSLVLQHNDAFSLQDLQAVADELGIDIGATHPFPQPVELLSPAPPSEGRRERLIGDLEALLLLGLVVVWIRDLILNRTLRISTLLLLILTGLNLYQFWQRRRAGAIADETLQDLEPI